MKDLVLTIWAVMVVALLAAYDPAALAAARPSLMQGVWRSGDTALRVNVTGSEAKGVFAAVSEASRAIGFKPGDVSFVATVMGNYLYGQQTIRYGGNCHANGRKVPLIGRLAPNGQVLAIHFYGVEVDANCQDTGQVSVTETLWQRQPAR